MALEKGIASLVNEFIAVQHRLAGASARPITA